MRREITVYIRFAGAETETCLEEMANSFYIALEEVRQLEQHQGYTPLCVIAQGEQAQIVAFTEALRESGPGLSVGQVSVREV